MAIDRPELLHAKEFIEQAQKNATEERKKICECVYNIREIEAQLTLRRRTLVDLEKMALDKFEEVFKLVRSELNERS